MQRLICHSSRTSRRVAWGISRNAINNCSRLPLHLVETPHRETSLLLSTFPFSSTPTTTPTSRSLSTSVPNSNSNSNVSPDVSNTASIEQVALQYARQGNPSKAQELLEQLPSDSPSVAVLWTSVIDAWLQYQTKQFAILEEVLRQSDTSTIVLRDRIEEICQAATSASELVEKDLHHKKVSPHHVLMVLKAWATVCEATRMAAISTQPGDWAGIPQRAQHILTQYQQLTGTKPSTEAVNQVLKAWAYSGEYLRGTMAEQFYAKHKDPNGETFRIMIRAWSWSKERNDAYAATGYFLRMMRLLALGEMDMRPTLDDYRVLFQVWPTTK